MLKQKFHAFTLRPVEPGRFALCDQKLRGPFADNADGVTCKRCLRWPDLVRGVFATQDKARDELGRMIDALPIARPQLRLVPSVRVSPETEERLRPQSSARARSAATALERTLDTMDRHGCTPLDVVTAMLEEWAFDDTTLDQCRDVREAVRLLRRVACNHELERGLQKNRQRLARLERHHKRSGGLDAGADAAAIVAARGGRGSVPHEPLDGRQVDFLVEKVSDVASPQVVRRKRRDGGKDGDVA
jgi:hypothetical protein